MNSSPAEDKHNRIADSVELLYQNSFGSILICMLASTALVFAFPESLVFETKMIWWAAINMLMFIRLLDTLWWRKQHTTNNSSPDNPSYWLAKFRMGAILTALFWGAFGAVVMHQMGDVEFVTTVIILAALAGAAPTPLSADKFLAIVYSALLITPISVVGILGPDYMRQVLGVMGIFFALTMVFSALKITRFTQDAISLKHRNADLLAQVSADKKTLAEQNTLLETSYHKINDIKNGLEQEVARRTAELRTLSEQDSLTGLLNRKAFVTRLQDHLQSQSSNYGDCAIIFIDLNKFKTINDMQGHSIGDRVLIEVANVLTNLPGAPTVCRWGGDEFVIFLEVDGKQLTLELCELINAEISDANQAFGMDISASLGVAFAPSQGRIADELIKLADIAMFQHKQAPFESSAVVFESTFLSALERAESLRVGLANAISKNELSLVFQPIYNLDSGRIESYETLLRWHFINEVIEPEEFVPLAEQTGIVYELGLWVLARAIEHMKTSAQSSDIKLAVNVSVKQMKHPNFARDVMHLLKEIEFSPSRLHLEITETIFNNDPKAMLGNLSQLRSFGVTFGLDDFGTGYSSMVQLQALPFSSIKIDKRFVQDIDGSGAAIIKSIVLLARELDAEVVAEGVENHRQLDCVFDMGVRHIQGYFLAKPQKQVDPNLKAPVVFDSYKSFH